MISNFKIFSNWSHAPYFNQQPPFKMTGPYKTYNLDVVFPTK